MAFRINADDCVSCGTCAEECPVEAISQGDESYVIDEDSPVNNSTTRTIRMDDNVEVAFTNVRKAVSPTGIRQITVPFMIILGLGIVMVPVVVFGRKRRREED